MKSQLANCCGNGKLWMGGVHEHESLDILENVGAIDSERWKRLR